MNEVPANWHMVLELFGSQHLGYVSFLPDGTWEALKFMSATCPPESLGVFDSLREAAQAVSLGSACSVMWNDHA